MEEGGALKLKRETALTNLIVCFMFLERGSTLPMIDTGRWCLWLEIWACLIMNIAFTKMTCLEPI